MGAIASNYQRLRVENVAGRLGLTVLAYLWERDQIELLAEMIAAGLIAILVKVAAIGSLASELCSSLMERSSKQAFGKDFERDATYSAPIT